MPAKLVPPHWLPAWFAQDEEIVVDVGDDVVSATDDITKDEVMALLETRELLEDDTALEAVIEEVLEELLFSDDEENCKDDVRADEVTEELDNGVHCSNPD